MPRELNIMADIMTRWMRGYRSTDRATGRISRLRNPSGREMVPIAPPDLANWPFRDNVRRTQTSALQRPTELTADDDGLLQIQSKIWIPTDADVLKLKLFTVSHAGQAGHRGSDATSAILRE